MTKTTARCARFVKFLTDLRCSAEIRTSAEKGGYRLATVTGDSNTPIGQDPKVIDCCIQDLGLGLLGAFMYEITSLTPDGEVLMSLFSWEE